MKTPAKILAGALLVALVATNAATWYTLRATRSELGSAQAEGTVLAYKLASSEADLATARSKIEGLKKDLNEGLDLLQAETKRLAAESEAMQRPFARDEYLGTVTTTTGRTINDAMLMQLSAASLTLRTTDSIASIPIRELQPELRLRAAASLFERSWTAAPGTSVRPISLASTQQPARYTVQPAQVYRAPAPPPAVQATDTAQASVDFDEIKRVAAAYAETYYERNRIGSSNSWSFAANSLLEEPQAMAGWGDQWRVSGSIGTRDLTAQGGISSPTHRFEAIVAKRGESYTVIDFTKR